MCTKLNDVVIGDIIEYKDCFYEVIDIDRENVHTILHSKNSESYYIFDRNVIRSLLTFSKDFNKMV